MERAIKINALSHPPPQLWSLFLISSTERWRTGSGSAERKGTAGEGEGEWKLQQPFYKAAWKQAEMLFTTLLSRIMQSGGTRNSSPLE